MANLVFWSLNPETSAGAANIPDVLTKADYAPQVGISASGAG
jgi:hypothetical protein